jgi:hypothetical protein
MADPTWNGQPQETSTLPDTPPPQTPTDGPQASMLPAGMSMGTGQPPQPITPSDLKQLDVFRDPKFMAQAAELALSRGQPEGLQWLQHIHTALQENAGEALQNLIAGNGDGAVKAFNKSGMYQDAQSATPNGDGTWTLTRTNGQSIQVDPQKAAAALMSPEAYATQQRQSQLVSSEVEKNKAMGSYYNDRNETQQAIAGVRAQAQNDVQSAKNEAAGYKARLDAATKMTVASSKGKIVDPSEQFDKLSTEFSKNPLPGERPEDSAMKVVISNPWATQIEQNAQGGIDVRSKADGSLVKQFPDQGSFEKFLGKPIYVPKNPAAAPPGPQAKTVGQVTPVAPRSAAGGLTPQLPVSQTAPDSPAGRAQARIAAAGAAQKSTAPDTQAAFDRDKQSMDPLTLAQTYDGKRGDLTNAQITTLNAAIAKAAK